MATVSIEEEDLSRLLREKEELENRVGDLLHNASRDRLASLARQVRTFMFATDQPVRATPTADIPEAEVRFRLCLIAEEFTELLTACGIHLTTKMHEELFEALGTFYVKSGDKMVIDLPDVVDAIADLFYVLEGTAAAFGVHMPPAIAEVHATNMAKLVEGRVLRNAAGKVVKPEGWKSPDLVGVLRRQGWTG